MTLVSSGPFTLVEKFSIRFDSRFEFDQGGAIRLADLIKEKLPENLPKNLLEHFRPTHFENVNVDVMYETAFLGAKGPRTHLSQTGKWDHETITTPDGDYPISEFVDDVLARIGPKPETIQVSIAGPGVHHNTMIWSSSEGVVYVIAIATASGEVSVYKN